MRAPQPSPDKTTLCSGDNPCHVRKLSLKEYLCKPIASQKVTICKRNTETLRHYDSLSYEVFKEHKKDVIIKKRKAKEHLKYIRDSLEKQQRSFNRQEFGSNGMLHSRTHSHQMAINYKPMSCARQLLDFSAKVVQMNPVMVKKHHSEALPLTKMVSEDHSRNFEDAEKTSTAISIQERQSTKDFQSRNYGSSPEPLYEPVVPQKQQFVRTPVVEQSQASTAREELAKEKSLLDELFDQNKKDMEEYGPEYSY